MELAREDAIEACEAKLEENQKIVEHMKKKAEKDSKVRKKKEEKLVEKNKGMVKEVHQIQGQIEKEKEKIVVENKKRAELINQVPLPLLKPLRN
jgi:hypothetical protein